MGYFQFPAAVICFATMCRYNNSLSNALFTHRLQQLCSKGNAEMGLSGIKVLGVIFLFSSKVVKTIFGTGISFSFIHLSKAEAKFK